MKVVQRFYHLILFLCLLAKLTGNAVAADKSTYSIAISTEDIIAETLLERVAQELSVNFELVRFAEYAPRLDAVISGEVDFASSVTYTDERAKNLIFSAPTNLEYTYLFSSTKTNIKDISTLAVPSGTVFAELMRTQNPNLQVVEFNTIAEAKDLLFSGKVEGVVDSAAQLRFMALAGMNAQLLNYQFPLKPVSLVTAKPENIELLKKMEQYLHQPERQRLIRTTAENYQFEVQRQALRKRVLFSGVDLSRPFKVIVEDYRRYGVQNDNGKVIGIAADVIFEACQLMRLECDVQTATEGDWQSMYESLRSGEIDILSPIAIVPGREELVHISDRFYKTESIVVKRNGYKDGVYRTVSELISERIGVIKGGMTAKVLHRRLPHKSFRTYTTAKEQLKALLANEVDYIAMPRLTYNELVRDTRTILPIVEDHTIGTVFSYGIGIAFRKNDEGEKLSELFNEAIRLIDMNNVIKKYDYQPDWQQTLFSQKKFTKQSQQLFLVITLTLVVLSYIWHKQSITDSLTKLKNRLALYKKYKHGLYPGQILVYFDVNKFKTVNDTYGHTVGDEVLKKISENIRHYWNCDSYRIGGDEFILIGRIREQDIERMLSNIGCFEFTDHSCRKFNVTISYGYYLSSNDGLLLDDCIHIADIQMYKAKMA
ncbi:MULTISPECIES: GGDEF domain-containing protein [Vibrio]|uniref:Diguanylate cyclase (GGDEF)-like protein n=1 Tax=Vibrio diazotrophicus TaxID=685 RepID=A0A329E720_VIBDI|nr:GGDEF domain-containing protein [Vibrio diazotrophicus]PNI00164.1 GGDEF domain-containing protein [Vibrio diazotrophicus]RAS61511.1 diguanylate cyclase (GGDEF)-like protein [Vibrio diazotrophicus]